MKNCCSTFCMLHGASRFFLTFAIIHGKSVIFDSRWNIFPGWIPFSPLLNIEFLAWERERKNRRNLLEIIFSNFLSIRTQVVSLIILITPQYSPKTLKVYLTYGPTSQEHVKLTHRKIWLFFLLSSWIIWKNIFSNFCNNFPFFSFSLK